jgi:hypothetical protein
MADRLMRRLFWRVADQFDYLVTLARLRVLDALAVPLPETPPISSANVSGRKVLDKPLLLTETWKMTMKIRFAAVAAFLLASAFPQLGHAQGYIQIPIPGIPGVGPPPPPPQERGYDRGWREHCEHLRDREHELRDRLAYAPPYSEERERLEHRLREVHYEREQCWRR